MFIHTVQTKYSAFKGQLTKALNALVANNDEQKHHEVELLESSARTLMSILADQDVPEWLRSTVSQTQQFRNDHTNPAKLMQFIINNYQAMVKHKWEFEAHQGKSYDVDEMYVEVVGTLELDDTFNDLIERLREIIESGDIDSIAALESLRQLEALVLQNKDSSFLGLSATVKFGRAFFKHFTWEMVKRIPGVKESAKAAEKAFNELDDKEQKAILLVREKLSSRFNDGIKNISNNTQFQLDDKTNKQDE